MIDWLIFFIVCIKFYHEVGLGYKKIFSRSNMNQIGVDIFILTIMFLAFDGCYLYASTKRFEK